MSNRRFEVFFTFTVNLFLFIFTYLFFFLTITAEEFEAIWMFTLRFSQFFFVFWVKKLKFRLHINFYQFFIRNFEKFLHHTFSIFTILQLVNEKMELLRLQRLPTANNDRETHVARWQFVETRTRKTLECTFCRQGVIAAVSTSMRTSELWV